jgi:hypothetical protein
MIKVFIFLFVTTFFVSSIVAIATYEESPHRMFYWSTCVAIIWFVIALVLTFMIPGS